MRQLLYSFPVKLAVILFAMVAAIGILAIRAVIDCIRAVLDDQPSQVSGNLS